MLGMMSTAHYPHLVVVRCWHEALLMRVGSETRKLSHNSVVFTAGQRRDWDEIQTAGNADEFSADKYAQLLGEELDD